MDFIEKFWELQGNGHYKSDFLTKFWELEEFGIKYSNIALQLYNKIVLDNLYNLEEHVLSLTLEKQWICDIMISRVYEALTKDNKKYTIFVIDEDDLIDSEKEDFLQKANFINQDNFILNA